MTPQHVSINKPRNLPRFDDKVMVRTPNILAWHQMSTRNGGQHRTTQLSQFVWHGIESNFCVFPSFKKKRAVHTKSVNFARNAATSVRCWFTNAVAPANAILCAGAETKVKCSWLQLFACVLFRHGHVPQLFFVNLHSASVHFLIVNVYKIGSQFRSCWGPNFPQDVFFRKCSEVKTVKVLDLFNTFGIPASEGLSSTELQSMQANFGSDRHGIDFSVCTNMHVNRLENIPNFSHIHMHNFSHTNWQIQTNAFCWNKIVIYRTCTGKPAGLRTLNSKFETCI